MNIHTSVGTRPRVHVERPWGPCSRRVLVFRPPLAVLQPSACNSHGRPGCCRLHPAAALPSSDVKTAPLGLSQHPAGKSHHKCHKTRFWILWLCKRLWPAPPQIFMPLPPPPLVCTGSYITTCVCMQSDNLSHFFPRGCSPPCMTALPLQD